MSARNALTCSSEGPVATLVFVVGRVLTFGVVGVLLPLGLGVVGFVFVVGGFFGCGFFGCGFFGILISTLPILICADAPMANIAVMNTRPISLVIPETCLFMIYLHLHKSVNQLTT